MIRLHSIAAVFLGIEVCAFCQSVSNYAVQVTALVQTNPPTINLSWVADSYAADYSIAKKLRDEVNWVTVAALPGGATDYADAEVTVGGAYEYSIYKTLGDNSGEGYVYAGILTPLTENRGKVILIVENTHVSDLATELARLSRDLTGDGWVVLRHDVPRMEVNPADTSPGVGIARSNELAAVKALIKADYDADPGKVKAVVLFGHIPVPYSGNFKPDAHDDHKGAWPADLYYGDMVRTWSDSSVDNSTADDPRNRNVPGDGKFDESDMPDNVALQVGRVDFANLPAFPQGERELLRQYLNKDHNFRHSLVSAQRQGLIDDNFGVVHYGLIGIGAFAANGWRNFSPFFGPSNIVAGDWLTTPVGHSYLWAYGCGSGTFTSAGDVANTWNLVTNDTPFVFTMFFGSYFGDWDSQNNSLRAQLATATYTLTSAWVGRPYWYFHHMGLGETIGFSTRVSQNNYYDYGDSLSMYLVHVALMGDPTLRMHVVAPPSGLAVVSSGVAGVQLSWNASPDSVLGYHVYQGATAAGPFTRINSNLVTSTIYAVPEVTTNVYMVRAVKLEVSGSGSYYNGSQGIFQSLDGRAGAPMVVLRQPTNNAVFVAPTNISLAATTFDPANRITNVTFYANGVKIGDAAAVSASAIWSNATVGSHTLAARAFCLDGLVTNSTPVSIVVAGDPPTLALWAAAGVVYGTGIGRPAGSYRVESVSSLGEINWQTLLTATSSPAGIFHFTDTASSTQRFYRAVFP